MIRIFTLALVLLATLNIPCSAQSRGNFTSKNTILISIEGTAGMYEYSSNELMVRYNPNTHKVECVFNVTRLLPANDSSPVVIVHDVFFVSKYPEVLIEIDAPEGNAQVSSAAPQGANRNARLYLQGSPIDVNIPVNFSPDRRTLLFSSSFDILMPDHKVSLPAKYIPMLSGRILFTIRNAKWAVLDPR